MEKVVSDSGVIKIAVRTITDPAHVEYAAQVLAAARDHRADLIADGGERAFWFAKCAHTAEAGGLLGLYVNGGMPCGAAVIERSIQQPGTAWLLAATSMWDRDGTEPALRQVAIDEATAQGLALWEATHTITPLTEDTVVIDVHGARLTTATAYAQKTVKRIN